MRSISCANWDGVTENSDDAIASSEFWNSVIKYSRLVDYCTGTGIPDRAAISLYDPRRLQS
jgi:hypothetical protein